MSWRLCNKAMQDASVVLVSFGVRIYFNQDSEQWMRADSQSDTRWYPTFGDGDWSEYVATVPPSFVITPTDVGRKVLISNGSVGLITIVSSLGYVRVGVNRYTLSGVYLDSLIPSSRQSCNIDSSITGFVD